MLNSSRKCATGFLFMALLVVAGTVLAQTQTQGNQVFTVGWHDEFNTLDNWAPWTAFGSFDILRGDVGKLTIVVGKTAIRDTNFNNYRAGVYQDFDVDLEQYPILAVHVLRMQGAATWDAEVGEYRDEARPEAHDTSRGGNVARPGNPKQLVFDTVGDSHGQRKAGVVFVPLTPSPMAAKANNTRVCFSTPTAPGRVPLISPGYASSAKKTWRVCGRIQTRGRFSRQSKKPCFLVSPGHSSASPFQANTGAT